MSFISWIDNSFCNEQSSLTLRMRLKMACSVLGMWGVTCMVMSPVIREITTRQGRLFPRGGFNKLKKVQWAMRHWVHRKCWSPQRWLIFQIIKECNSVSWAAFVNTTREFQAHCCTARYTMIPWGFPTKRSATRLGNEGGNHKTRLGFTSIPLARQLCCFDCSKQKLKFNTLVDAVIEWT